ncbi:Cell adhesion protein byn-1 [Aphelenchoides fujianensis]|nr:Cell adhesion protein byn-1 [Aphelenchoides fujianensis]
MFTRPAFQHFAHSMGKRKHIKSGAGDVVQKPQPLTAQIENEKVAKQREPRGILKKARMDDEFVPDKISERILKLAAEQQAEEEPAEEVSELTRVLLLSTGQPNDPVSFRSALSNSGLKVKQALAESDSDEDEDEEDAGEAVSRTSWKSFLHDEEGVRSTVSRRSRRSRTESQAAEEEELDATLTAGLSQNVIQMYKEIGQYMSHYRSGKIPKAFKTIPALLNWEQILEITCPEKYTAASMLHATRLFSATASPKVCERFYRYYLLPRVLDDIMEFRKLNVHLFNALKKAVYKPTAFVKGILLPMCNSDAFSMIIAHVVRGVLNAVSLPVFHAATAMIKISRLPISSPVSHVLTGLVNKRYTLPSMALDAVIRYFCSYELDEEMPLSLNTCIQTFVQLYKLELSDEQKKTLIELLKAKGHKMASSIPLQELESTFAPAE